MRVKIVIVLLFVLVISTTAYSNSFLKGTFVGIINVHLNSDVSLVKTGANSGIYFLHTSMNNKPFKLVFKHGRPNTPIMTGDKVIVVGLNAANTLFVEKIKSLPNNTSSF